MGNTNLTKTNPIGQNIYTYFSCKTPGLGAFAKSSLSIPFTED